MATPDPLLALQADVASYYGQTLRRHGTTPLGVDWTCEPTQQLRFVQLLGIVAPARPFTVNDLGCGCGALLPFMRRRHRAGDIDYLGIDIAESMVQAARKLHARRRNARFECALSPSRIADYGIASGVFNVRLAHGDGPWTEWVARTLATLAETSRVAFAVNFLDHLPPGATGPRELYRTTPDEWRGWCERKLGWRCEVRASYGLREFTLHCRR